MTQKNEKELVETQKVQLKKNPENDWVKTWKARLKKKQEGLSQNAECPI